MDDLSGFNPKRRLCPDGACTGIIGPDGRCGECGRASSGASDETSETDMFAVLDASDEIAESAAAMDGASTSSTLSSASDGGFDPNRRLCRDGTCVGFIGPTGTCTVCGQAAG